MTDQPTLFEPPPAPAKRKRHRTADTSSVAFHASADRRGHQAGVVLETLRSFGPMTRHEIAAACALPLSSVCGRVNELVKAGEVRDRVVAGRKVRTDGRQVVEAVITHTMRRAG